MIVECPLCDWVHVTRYNVGSLEDFSCHWANCHHFDRGGAHHIFVQLKAFNGNVIAWFLSTHLGVDV